MKYLSTIFICVLLLAGCREELPSTSLELSEDRISCTKEGGEYNIMVDGRYDWTTDNTADWIHIRRIDGNALVTIDRNEGGNRQSTVGFLTDGIKRTEILITQEHSDFFSISQESAHIKYKGEEFSLTITCYDRWKVATDSEWVSFSTIEGNGPEAITIFVSRNDGKEAREGSVTFSCGEKSIKMVITQEMAPYIELEKQTADFDGDGGQAKVLYISNSDIIVSCTDDWIRIIETDNKINIVKFEVLRNISEAREGRIRISSAIDQEIFSEIIIRQGPKIDHPRLSFAEGTLMVLSSREPISLTPVFEDMTDTTLKWSSDNPETASVNNEGLVNIHNGGLCTITAVNSFHNVKAQIRLDIRPKAEGMTVMFGKQNMNENPVAVRFSGETMEIKVILEPSDAYADDLTYFSSDETVAKINGTIITCLKQGKAEIFIESSYQSLRQSYIVTVL